MSDYFINHAEQSRNESHMTEEEFIQLFTPIAKKSRKDTWDTPKFVDCTSGTRIKLGGKVVALDRNQKKLLWYKRNKWHAVCNKRVL